MRILTIKATANGITLASPTAKLGETSNGGAIYQIDNVPDDITINDAIATLHAVALPWRRHRLDWSECTHGANLTFR